MTTVLVASGGGHLRQLVTLAPRMGLEDDIIWVTPHSGLSEDVLRDAEHVAIPYTAPRDWRGALRLTGLALNLLKSLGAIRVISTGASPAPPFFLAGASLGLDLHYVESATRSDGPSLSGRLVARVPSAHLYTQYPQWADERWKFVGSIFDPYSSADSQQPPQPVRRVVVTLGTEAYGFRRALERLIPLLPDGAEVLWQTGHTDVRGLGIDARESIPGDELRAAMAEADLIVSHAGTGSALTCFDLGKVPLLIPREARHREHVDDHQFQTAREMTRRGLAVAVPVDDLKREHLSVPATRRVMRRAAEPFPLQETHAGKPSLIDLRGARPRVVRGWMHSSRLSGDGAHTVIDLRDRVLRNR